MRAESCKTQADIDREDRAFRREVDEYLAENDLQAVPVGAIALDLGGEEARYINFLREIRRHWPYGVSHLHGGTSQLDNLIRQIEASIKPPEPTGLGAVVEDNKGRRFVRFTSHDIKACWRVNYLDTAAYPWSEIDAVKVLNQGVTS